jgi:hypothetical protein
MFEKFPIANDGVVIEVTALPVAFTELSNPTAIMYSYGTNAILKFKGGLRFTNGCGYV